ncbi:hypothetical protein CMEL01_11335 [Colletotrichum melonis]|uniref:Uncharacterized protein n=1 Tax=Colletotrichum melonis TaxID=1209925 RepID=A0AAI9Y1J7_9PEZI|nr:hypothetical protein CMEL01_11335 [Colletotrichum melonis]
MSSSQPFERCFLVLPAPCLAVSHFDAGITFPTGGMTDLVWHPSMIQEIDEVCVSSQRNVKTNEDRAMVYYSQFANVPPEYTPPYDLGGMLASLSSTAQGEEEDPPGSLTRPCCWQTLVRSSGNHLIDLASQRQPPTPPCSRDANVACTLGQLCKTPSRLGHYMRVPTCSTYLLHRPGYQ